jgi:glucosamine 6-phosphate synthetase-like amidotransferase/phosphosugar isomerase protein
MENKVPPALRYFDIVKGTDLNKKDLDDYTAQIRAICSEFPQTVETLKEVIHRGYDKVYAIGIGDSLYSAESVKLGFWKDSGVQVEVLESQEFNNYYIDYMPKNSLVFVCSGGGAAARTVETSYLAHKRGATVVAVTLTPKSRLSASCEHLLCYHTDAKNFIDGSRNYISLSVLLKIIGIKMGVWNGILDARKEEEALQNIVTNMRMGFQTCITHEPLIKKLMHDAKDLKQFYFLGAGPSLSLAEYGASKFMEQSAADGIWQQLEEYGHEQYWTHNRKGENSFVVSICPDGKTAQRCAENIDEQNFLNLTTVLLTTAPVNSVLKNRAKFTMATESSINENDFWMVACNILSRMANYYTEYVNLLGKKFMSADQFVEHYKTIHYGRLVDEVAEHDIECPDDQTIAERGAYGLAFEKDKKS